MVHITSEPGYGDDVIRSGFKRYGYPVLFPFLLNRVIVRIYPFEQPAILLLSYPRCGSSWIGRVLSYSPDLLYLREPVNQAFQKKFNDWAVIDPGRDQETWDAYLEFAKLAFSGIPTRYAPGAVSNLGELLPGKRKGKWLLIKEVNPLAADMYVKNFSPKIVYILRHPAGVANSFYRLGWIGSSFEEFGVNYGAIQSQAIDAIEKGWHKIIRYEDLANEPGDRFSELFDDLEIRRPTDYEAIISKYSESDEAGDDPYRILRKSRSQVEKWRVELSPSQIEQVMSGYERTAGKIGSYAMQQVKNV